MTTTTKELRVHIRWMIRRDMEEVLAIEELCFPYPWSNETFITYLRERNTIGMVAEYKDAIVGYMVYTLCKTKLDLLNFAVAPKCQGKTIGRQMIRKLENKLSETRRTRVTCEVREGNTDAHLFLRACGFRCVNVIRDFYEPTDESAYLFQLRYVPIERSQTA